MVKKVNTINTNKQKLEKMLIKRYLIPVKLFKPKALIECKNGRSIKKPTN